MNNSSSNKCDLKVKPIFLNNEIAIHSLIPLHHEGYNIAMNELLTVNTYKSSESESDEGDYICEVRQKKVDIKGKAVDRREPGADDIRINNEMESSDSNVNNLQVDSVITLVSLDLPCVRADDRFLVDFRRLKIVPKNISSWETSDKGCQNGNKSDCSELWCDDDDVEEMDIEVVYNNWDPYLERVVYILKDYKFERLFIVLRWINGQETVHWAEDAYCRCPQKVIEFYESSTIFIDE
ncbi:7264_t:CDS:2 [Cetraspora pellucida]|uniref:7264_t:CDS:1 n=1 Tax=Cetraspora pellucida TaxID=1433469 RepID=A0A9N9AED7_9GLOM|nr:7264_t:CDS:2 [Cetraspora pellucida]